MDESLTPKIIRIATRKSPLALWQAQMVGQQIKKIDETESPKLYLESLSFIPFYENDFYF